MRDDTRRERQATTPGARSLRRKKARSPTKDRDLPSSDVGRFQQKSQATGFQKRRLSSCSKKTHDRHPQIEGQIRRKVGRAVHHRHGLLQRRLRPPKPRRRPVPDARKWQVSQKVLSKRKKAPFLPSSSNKTLSESGLTCLEPKSNRSLHWG